MKYQHTFEQSAEYLRLAIPLMSKQAAACHPISYALWYEYVSGINDPLAREIDGLLGGKRQLTDEQALELFRKHISEYDEEAADRLHADFQRLLTGLLYSAEKTGDQAAHFGNALEQCSRQLEANTDAASLQRIAHGMLGDTHRMQAAIEALQTQLEESTREADQLRHELHRARTEAMTDALTGLLNRNGFNRAIEDAVSPVNASPVGPCLLMLDIDHFKRVNDTYGHLLGDKVIRAVADVLKANIKGRDIAARYGGEEFALLLPETPLAGAGVLAEKIRATVGNARIRQTSGREPLDNFTVSVGVACHRDGESATMLISRADTALYASKNQGRNRVTVH